jgi:hypothetical protein
MIRDCLASCDGESDGIPVSAVSLFLLLARRAADARACILAGWRGQVLAGTAN